MKKRNFTFSTNWAIVARTLTLVFFVSLFTTLNSLQAQIIIMQYAAADTTCTADTLALCGGAVTSADRQFTDDGSNDGNYKDNHQRRDTVEICPIDRWHRVQVVFTDFDLEAGDSLVAFDGSKDSVRQNAAVIIGTGSGVGNAKAFGGWVNANCNPKVNPTGCLTFILKTDGDNRKGRGWDAWVDCEERNITLEPIDLNGVKLTCADNPYATITIPAPKVNVCGTPLASADDRVIVRVKNQHGIVCEAQEMSEDNGDMMIRDFAIGQYLVECKLLSDTTKVIRQYFSVQAPSLVCNDEINVSLGAACMAVLGPDDVLENPCDTITGYMYYNITVTLGTGKNEVVLKTTGHDNLGPVTYPVITVDTIKAAGLSVCGGTATVNIERIYYGDRNGDNLPDLPAAVDCDNGTKALSCETIVKFEDESKPWVDIQSIPDTLIACDTAGLAALLDVNGVDNCDDDVPVTFAVAYTETDPCFAELGSRDTTMITITFSATDDCGNIGTATKEITMIRPDIHNPIYVAKTNNVQLECTDNTSDLAYPGLKIGIWKNNAFEVRDTLALNTETYVCGYILTTSEEGIPTTDCGSKKFHYWDALDWCDPNEGPKRIDTTFVEYTDTTAPVFVIGEGMPIDVELDHFSCTYDIYKIIHPKATDNCDETPTVRIDMISRIEDGARWMIDPADWAVLDCDSFEVKWIASDDCHEQLKNDTLLQIVVIKDVTLPSAHCIDELNVSLPNEWGARVYAEDIDAGSYDACGIKSRLIRIKGTDDEFAAYVNIGCEYVHPNLQLELQITDYKDNVNVCWLDVEVEDKIVPYCAPLENIEGDCEDYHNGDLGLSTDTDEDFEMEEAEYLTLDGDLLTFYNQAFGNPATLKICEDNLKTAECGELTFEQEYQLIEWPCREAKAKRRYRAVYWSGNKSAWTVQQISISAKQNWKITFPADWEGACGDMAPAEDLLIENGACDLLGYEVTERQFEIPGDACFKIERTYHIINWCKYTAGDDPIEIARVEGDHGVVRESYMITSEGNEDKGYWTYIQVLKVHDDVAPVVTVIDPDPCINAIEFDAEPYGEEDITVGAAPYECDELKTWTATAVDCSANINWVGRLYRAGTDELVKEVESNELSYVVSNKESYYAEFWAYDNCGNSGGAKGEVIKFWDCKKPTPYILNGTIINLMETGLVQVWATDLNLNSFDNCTDQSNLDFRIWADFYGAEPTTLLEVFNLGKVLDFDCSRVGTNAVRIYVIDEEGNWDFAETYVIIQDNMEVCNGLDLDGMIAGKIVTPTGENVEAVEIILSGTSDAVMTTGANGQFSFNMENGGDYTVTPVKDINPLNGVSTFDLVLISKHILGITTFDSPYKYIAADVNQSGTITAFDMVQLRQLILNITTEFSNNDSWRFVDASHNFASVNPAAEDFNESYTITALNGEMMDMDFVGVKIGDVNGNAQANSLLGTESRTTNGTLSLTTTDRFVEAGQTVTVAFTAADIANTQGYQFTLKVAGQNVEIIEGVAKATNFNTNMAERGIITTSWNGEARVTDELFEVSFTATIAGLLSELVAVNSDITTAEAYNTAGELMDINLNFTTAAATGFDLSQNTPNPFKEATVIDFNLPVAGMATLTVMDVQGKILKSIKGEFAKGANQIMVKVGELGATGVLYYQLASADNVATKKMIVLE